MSKLIIINKDFDPTANFWDLNPQLILIPPFSQLYSTDGGGDYSSKLAWSVYFVSDPDENENKFFRLGNREEIQDVLAETYFKEQVPDFELEEYLNCVKAYPEVCLTSVQRAFMKKKRALLARGEFLDNTPYTSTTMKDLDYAHSKTVKIFEDYEKIENKFFAEKSKSRIKGGRSESKSEKREI